jgi:ArsR family transcriptional regulator, arsenate/arsenite/antimonite-responsive transcriptional repressor
MESIQAVAALAALAQENRLVIYRHLVQAGPQGLPVGKIGERLGLPGATLSFHLNALKQAGLVTCNRKGRSLIYAPDFQRMSALLGYLLNNCCGGACPPTMTSTQSANRRTT